MNLSDPDDIWLGALEVEAILGDPRPALEEQLVLAARLHLDDGAVAGHFRANPNSIYITSQAAKTISVVLKADGFAPVSVDIAKDKGGAEAAD